jgi:hypothetical protein
MVTTEKTQVIGTPILMKLTLSAVFIIASTFRPFLTLRSLVNSWCSWYRRRQPGNNHWPATRPVSHNFFFLNAS